MPYTRYLYDCKPAVLLLVLCFVFMYNIARATPLAEVSAVDGATADSNVRFAGHVGGGSEAVYVTGSKAYVGEGPSLVILDITDPAKLIVLGKTAPGPGFITDVMVVGQYAYMVDSFGDLRIVDVTDPAQPRTVGLADTPGYSNGVYVLGALAFLANGFDGLRVVNVANPLAPSEVGAYDTPGIAYGVVAVGNFAFVADGSSGLRIINVATPTTPSEAGFYDTPDDARGLDVANNIAYVADGDSGLQIINVTNPAVRAMAFAVSVMIGRLRHCGLPRISRVAVSPSISGIITSISTRSTGPLPLCVLFSRSCSASRPLRAIST